MADEAGAGKSPQVVAGADLCGARKVLLACPAAVRPHWENTFLDWQRIDRPVALVEGNVKEPPGDGVTVVSHAAFADRDSVTRMRDGAPYDLVVVDESHFMRGSNASRTVNVMFPDGAWTWAPQFWCLTGTPIVSSAADLWPMVYGPLRTPVAWYDWGCRYGDPVMSNGEIRFAGMRRADELADALRPHILRRTLAGVGIALPPLVVDHVPTPIPPDALRLAMAGLENWTPARLAEALDEKDELHDSALARVRRALGIAKASSAAALADAIIASGDGPVVVFFQHTDVRRMLHEDLSGRRGRVVSWLDGKSTPAQAKAAVSWLQAGRLDALLVQTDAGGVGITLTRAHRAIVAELPWTAVGLWQAAKRLHRIGQESACRIDVLRATGCWLEDALASAIGKKHRAAEELLSRLETTT